MHNKVEKRIEVLDSEKAMSLNSLGNCCCFSLGVYKLPFSGCKLLGSTFIANYSPDKENSLEPTPYPNAPNVRNIYLLEWLKQTYGKCRST